MKVYKPKFWDEKVGITALLLFPLSLITKLIVFLKKKIIESKEFGIPIICVGNIYLGGTGKTPTAIILQKLLSVKGKKPVIVEHQDEQTLIKNYTKNLILNRNRVAGILEAKNRGYNTVIMDDGFQDYSIKKNLSIICFNQEQLVGNGLVIPSGPLRENFESLKNIDVVIINGKTDNKFEKRILKLNKEILILYSKYKIKNIDIYRNKKFFAFAGIGNPDNFFKLMEKNKLSIKKKLYFPDHYEFSKYELKQIIDEAKKSNCDVITTEKDFCRIKYFKLNKIKFLDVQLEIKQKEKLLDKILKLYD